jgi:hypothetical protein
VLFENRKVRNKSIPKYAKMRSDFPLRVLSLFASIDRGLAKNKMGQLMRNYQLSPSVEEKGLYYDP